MSIQKTRLSVVLVIFISGLLISNSCTSGNPNDTDHVSKDIDVKEAQQMIQDNLNNQDFVILDTRTPREYENGHLENSVFLNYSSPTYKQEIEKLDRTKKYLIYCHSGGRSKTTLNMMKEMGFSEAYNMKGGIVAWSQAGYKLEK